MSSESEKLVKNFTRSVFKLPKGGCHNKDSSVSGRSIIESIYITCPVSSLQTIKNVQNFKYYSTPLLDKYLVHVQVKEMSHI